MTTSISVDIDFLSCPICLDQFKDPYFLQCHHSFCKTCLQDYSKDKVNIKCPICQAPTAVGGWKKDFRCQEFIDYLNKGKGIDSNYLKQCNACNSDISSEEVHLCKECEIVLCSSCSVYHKRTSNNKAHLVYTLRSENVPICAAHDKKLDSYCTEANCNSLVCHKCALVDHQGHSISKVDDLVKQNSSEVFEIIKNNELHIEELENRILLLKKNKESFEALFKEMELLLFKRRDSLLDMVNESMEKELTRISTQRIELCLKIAEDIHNLEKSRDRLANMKMYTASYFKGKPNSEILQAFQDIKGIFDTESNIQVTMLKCETLTILPREFDIAVISEYIDGCIGKMDIKIKEMNEFILKKESAAIQSISLKDPHIVSTVLNDNFSVIDMLYDSIRDKLFAIKGSGDKFSIVSFSENTAVDEYEIKNCYYKWRRNYLAMMNTGDVIVLCNSQNDCAEKLISLSNNLKSCADYPVSFCDMQYLKLICSSPCYEYLFFYSRDNYVYKFKPNTYNHEKASFLLPNTASYMAVCSNLDYIAFSGRRFKNIFLVSFETGSVLRTIGENKMYSALLFMSRDVLVSTIIEYARGSNIPGSLQLFNAANSCSLKQVQSFKWKGDCFKIHNVGTITQCSSTSIFVGDYHGDHNTIHKISFE